MPGKSSDMCQGEVAAITHREARRSDPLINSKLGQGSTRPSRPSTHAGSENVAGARRSPRMGSGNCTAQSRLGRASAGPRVSAALNDITNVSVGRPGQAVGKSGKPSISGQASAPAPDRAQQGGPRQVTALVPALPLATDIHPVQGDAENAQSAQEYAADIHSQLLRDEATFLPRPNYMDSQTDVNGKMRAILIDWLIEVHMKYRLRPETLFLTVNIIDRYLSCAHVMRKRLQLVGIVAMSVAAKFEEISPPEVADFVHITDNAYSKDDVLIMECTMLSALNFEIVVPTAAHFFESMQKANRCDDVHREVAEYLIELGILDMRMLHYTPSHKVAAAVLLSNELLGKRPVWPESMVQHSQHTEQVLRGCADEYRELLEAAPTNQLQAVRKKFSQPLRHSVARMTF